MYLLLLGLSLSSTVNCNCTPMAQKNTCRDVTQSYISELQVKTAITQYEQIVSPSKCMKQTYSLHLHIAHMLSASLWHWIFPPPHELTWIPLFPGQLCLKGVTVALVRFVPTQHPYTGSTATQANTADNASVCRSTMTLIYRLKCSSHQSTLNSVCPREILFINMHFPHILARDNAVQTLVYHFPMLRCQKQP